MTFKESLLKTLDFERPSVPPVCEFMGYWPETVVAYRDRVGGDDIAGHFNLGTHRWLPVNTGFGDTSGRKSETIVLEDGGDWEIVRSGGCVRKVFKDKDSSAMPQYLEFPIKNRADFEELVRNTLDPCAPERYPDNWDEVCREAEASDIPYELAVYGPFGFPRGFMGFEDMLFTFYDDPGLIYDMAMYLTDFLIKLWDKALRDITPAWVYLGEDLAYKTAPMASPAMIEKLIAPAWDKLNRFLKSRGVKRIILDSDGHSEPIFPLAIECGFTISLPIERAAGMDAEELRKKYPNLAMIGGVDKLRMAEGREAIDEEVEKAVRTYKMGGYVPSCDHSVPPIVSYDDYAYYINKLREELYKI